MQLRWGRVSLPCVLLLRYETQATRYPVLVRLWLEKIDAHRWRTGKDPLLPAMARSHPKYGPASVRPSELYRKHEGTFETTTSLTPRRHKVFTRLQYLKEKGFLQARSVNKTCHASFLRFFSLTTSHSFLVTALPR